MTKQRLLEDWWQVAQQDLPGSVMLAYRRSDVRELNEAARTVLRRARCLGPEAVEAVERAFVLLPDHGALREWGYVACSRARAETHVYLAERDPFELETPLRDPNPTTPPDRAARALERSSAAPLAIDQSRERRDPTMRRLTQEQEHLDQLHERTAERLAAAERELKNLHWWNRASRAELETQVARDRSALERAEVKREQLCQHAERRLQFLALARERQEHAPSLLPEPPGPRLEREPPGLALEL